MKTLYDDKKSKRVLKFESLEDRQLLAIGVAEFDIIREENPDIGLFPDFNHYNIIEISNDILTEDSLKNAIFSAYDTSQDDLIVIRTSHSLNKIVLAGNEIGIKLDSKIQGSITFVVLGDYKLTIDANQQSRVFNILEGHVLISGMNIIGGQTKEDEIRGGGILNAGNLTLIDVDIINNVSGNFWGAGGGISNTGRLTMKKTSIIGNKSYFGGGIESTGLLSLYDCTISKNSADESGGGGIVSSGITAISNCIISNNFGLNFGSGIFSDGELTISSSEVSNNIGSSGIFSNGKLVIINSKITGNWGEIGGGIYSKGVLKLSGCVVSGNSAIIGGGIANDEGYLLITNTTIAGNKAEYGGGVFSSENYAL
ncbi:MAG: hypothetical protein LBJ67_04735 [Planctomycetaceae bacterium]|jgi:hypothetical protein|nr:hypothetical protein [Planctomycetaceae bacterium]